jgi:zinc transport system substrate-binding protein
MGPLLDRIGWVVVMGALLLGACGDPAQSPDDRPRFVTTIPPFEMILSPLVEGRATVDRLLDPGASPHTYDPTPSDLRATTGATALVYGAEHLDGWAAGLSASRRLALADLVPPAARLTFEGDPDHGHTVDPHFWTDPLAVKQLVPVLADTLCAIDPPGCPTYRTNADSMITALVALDTRIRLRTQPIRDVPVVLSRPFFRYFLRRYGPRLAGVIELHPGRSPTPGRLHRLVDEARRAGARALLTQQSQSERAGAAVAEAAGLPVVALDPIGGTAGRATYAELLLANATILRDALAPAPGAARRIRPFRGPLGSAEGSFPPTRSSSRSDSP